MCLCAKGRHLQQVKSSQAHRTPSRIRDIPLDDNLAVRIRNLYALRLQNVPENQQRLSTDVGNAVLGIGDPKAENKLQRAVAECRQVTDNSALRQNPFKFRDSVDRKPADTFLAPSREYAEIQGALRVMSVGLLLRMIVVLSSFG
jgi:hypothetical protein